MIREDAKRSAAVDGAPQPESVDAFEAAIDDVLRLAMRLTAAIATRAYADGARLRGHLERALLSAQAIAERLADGAARADALHQLAEWQAAAARLLMIAPAPSTAAIAAAESGDDATWKQEERTWIAGRQASAMRPRLSLPRAHRDTRPESPQAKREAIPLGQSSGATAGSPARDPSVMTPDEAGTSEHSQRGTHDRRP
ncbi:MAG: hypothetical protein E6J90_17435 [Deltaproteobacteria bacterium]|nr:MAG: hypothetical protein E6J91_42330 [Deltaproteobacteria bacterium]TMQ19713.1 MAG: hypothetical protein E6J90_17435 [Deltaproteobacteria bacterium]